MLRQLPNGVRRKQAGDHGEYDRERRQPPGEARRGANRERGRHGWCHVRDRLKEDLRQADGVALEGAASFGGDSGGSHAALLRASEPPPGRGRSAGVPYRRKRVKPRGG